EKVAAAVAVEPSVESHGAPRQHGTGGLAALRSERAKQRREALGAALRIRSDHAGRGEQPTEKVHRAHVCSFPKRSRSTFFCTFPIQFLGSSPTKWPRFGTLKFASFRFMAPMISPSEGLICSALGTTTAVTASPKSGCGTPITADSVTPGSSSSASSISFG